MKIHRSLKAKIGNLLVLTASLFLLFPALAVKLTNPPDPEPRLNEARRSTAYLLDTQRGFTFQIPPAKKLLAVVSNANVTSSTDLPRDFSTSYTLRYRIYGNADELLCDRPYTLRAEVSGGEDPVTGEFQSKHFYVGLPLLPLSSRIFLIDLSGLPGTTDRVLLELEAASTPVANVAVRLYHRDHPPAYKLEYLWQRLSEERRARLARGNIFTPDLLTAQEKRNLLTNRWMPLAPEGVKEDDYRSITLYTDTGPVETRPLEETRPSGLAVKPGVVGVVPFPAATGEVHLELEFLPPSVANAEPVAPRKDVLLRWFAAGANLPIDEAVPLNKTKTTVPRECAPGELEIHSPKEVFVRAFLLTDNGDTEITPEPWYVRAYRMRPGRDVEFAVVTEGLSASTWRVDVRQLAPEGEESADNAGAEVRFQLLDENGIPTVTGLLPHQEARSLYDTVLGASGSFRVTERSRHYLFLPPRCTVLRLSCDRDDVLLSVATRPPTLPRRVRVPEDYAAFKRSERGTRNWFPVHPRNCAAWIREGHAVTVMVQSRPPATRRSTGTGDCHQLAYSPEGPARAYQALTPLRQPAHDREGSTSYYTRLPPVEPVPVWVIGVPGARLVTPEIIIHKPEVAPETIKIFVDGDLSFERILAGRTCEIAGPSLAPGHHEIRAVVAGAASVYIAPVIEPEAGLYLRRTVYALNKLPGKTFTCSVMKETSDEQVLSARLYMPVGSESRARVRVWLGEIRRRNAVTFDSWTFPEAIYDVQPPREGPTVPLLRSATSVLGEEQLFFFTLGSDLQPGLYPVHIALEEGPPCFLHLSSMLPGARESRKVFIEPVPGEGGDE